MADTSPIGPEVSLEIMIPNNLVPLIMGFQCKNIVDLESNSGARVQIEKEVSIGQAERKVPAPGNICVIQILQLALFWDPTYDILIARSR